MTHRIQTIDPGLGEFIRRLPKTETHLHMEGALPYDLLRRLDPEKFAQDPPYWEVDYRYPTFPEFERILIEYALQWFTAPERYHKAAKEVFARLQAQNVFYVETSFHLGIVEFLGIPGQEILAAIREAAPAGLEVRVFAGMLRNQYAGEMVPVIDSLPGWEGLAGVDLHGDETLPLEDWTPRVWEQVRAAGKFTKAHAGEFGGPENVRQAVEVLGVDRVQHGVSAAEDPGTVRFLVERGIALDVCPISNWKLQVVEDLEVHPIARLLESGVACTVNTDDPLSFGNSLVDEYAVLAGKLGFGREKLARVARHGFEVALWAQEEKAPFLRELDALIVSGDL